MKIYQNLRDVDERISILRGEVIRTDHQSDYNIHDSVYELMGELDNIRFEVYEYLDEIRVTTPDDWHLLRTEIDKKFIGFDDIKNDVTVHRSYNNSLIRLQ